MKRLILIFLLFACISGYSQVNGIIESKDVQIKYTPISPKGTIKLKVLYDIDSIKVHYWIYKEVDGIVIKTNPQEDCIVSWTKNDTYKETYQKFNAWIRNKYNIE